MWPGFDNSQPTRLAAAWADLWELLADGPLHWVEVRQVIAEAHPDLQAKTVENLMRTAIRERHLAKRGGYSRKRKTDTRTIERRTNPEAT